MKDCLGVDSTDAEPSVLSAAPRSSLRLVHLRDFEAARAVRSEDRERFLRRFTTLFIDDESVRHGGIGCVLRAVNVRGERFALKTVGSGLGMSESGEGGETSCQSSAVLAAFEEEYAAHQALSGIKGFPRLYGRAWVDGCPVLVMEWIEGVTLGAALSQLAIDEHRRLSPLVAARLGRDLFDLLTRMALMADGFSHRDISLANVMIDTAHLSVAQQVEEGSFELRLVDFGSAVVEGDQSPSVTAVHGTPRGATAAFAAPEMLTCDVPSAVDARRLPAVDVYAAASVLYLLLCGKPPFDLRQCDAGGAPLSPYRCKIEGSPAPFVSAHGGCAEEGMLADALSREPETAVMVGRYLATLMPPPSEEAVAAALCVVDDTLAPLILTCLDSDPLRRPTAEAMRDALAAFCAEYEENIGRSLRGQAVISCVEYLPLGPFGLTPRRFAVLARRVVDGVALLLGAAVALSSAALLRGTSVVAAFGSLTWEGQAPGIAVLLALAVPIGVGLIARGRFYGTFDGMLRGLLGAVLGAVAVLAFLLVVHVSPACLRLFLLALLATTAAAVTLFVSDYVWSDEGVQRWARKALPSAAPTLPAPSEEVLP